MGSSPITSTTNPQLSRGVGQPERSVDRSCDTSDTGDRIEQVAETGGNRFVDLGSTEQYTSKVVGTLACPARRRMTHGCAASSCHSYLWPMEAFEQFVAVALEAEGGRDLTLAWLSRFERCSAPPDPLSRKTVRNSPYRHPSFRRLMRRWPGVGRWVRVADSSGGPVEPAQADRPR